MSSQTDSRLYYRVTGDRKVYIFDGMNQLALLKGAQASDFITAVARLDEDEKQEYIQSFISRR
ncbi:MAG: hypothetical protein GF404_02015 [candidate division Zixibacteria bacterium]|nr:hypothetical protein [candidate division Zixibacteria bacterium]